MPTLLLDNFTGAAGALTSHTSDSGATWAAFDTDTAESIALTGSGAVNLLAAGAFNAAASNVTPAGDYSVVFYATASLTALASTTLLVQAVNNSTDYFGWYLELGASPTDVYAWLYVSDTALTSVDGGAAGITPGVQHKYQVNVSVDRTHYALYIDDVLTATLDSLAAVPLAALGLGGYCPVLEPAITLNSIEALSLTTPTTQVIAAAPSPLGAPAVLARRLVTAILQDDFAGASAGVIGRSPDIGAGNWAAAVGWGPSTVIHLDGLGNLYDSAGGAGDAVTAGGVFTMQDAHIVLRSTTPAAPMNLWGFGLFVGKHPDTEGEMIGFGVTYSSGSYKWNLSSFGASAGPTMFSPAPGSEHEFALQCAADGLTLFMDGTPLGTLPPYGGHVTSMVGADVSVTLQKSGAIGYISAADGLYSPPASKTLLIAAPSMLGAPAVLGYLPPVATIAVPGPLSAPAILAAHDFTGQLGDATTLYVMDLVTPGGTVRVPISSWQATLQTGSSNYVQCVVPACLVWASALNTATEFVIYRRAVLPSGLAIEYEMARAPAEQVQFDRGPQRYTCTLSGYSTAFAEALDPSAVYDRTLTGIRSISSGSTMRVRCAVDWLLRPGQRAFADGVPFVVDYINYYAPNGFDAYMDVGERA